MSDQSILSIEEETWSICGQNLMIFNRADYIMSKKGKTFFKVHRLRWKRAEIILPTCSVGNVWFIKKLSYYLKLFFKTYIQTFLQGLLI